MTDNVHSLYFRTSRNEIFNYFLRTTLRLRTRLLLIFKTAAEMSSLVVVVALFVPLREGVHVLIVEQGVVAVSPREFLLEK